jgi:hypothetical protein
VATKRLLFDGAAMGFPDHMERIVEITARPGRLLAAKRGSDAGCFSAPMQVAQLSLTELACD